MPKLDETRLRDLQNKYLDTSFTTSNQQRNVEAAYFDLQEVTDLVNACNALPANKRPSHLKVALALEDNPNRGKPDDTIGAKRVTMVMSVSAATDPAALDQKFVFLDATGVRKGLLSDRPCPPGCGHDSGKKIFS